MNAVDPSPAKKLKIQETASRYQCVVCQSPKTSLSELHWHQTYQHSTEELSLSVIGWKGLVKIIPTPAALSRANEKENTTPQRSIWNSFAKKPSQFYYLSGSILQVKDNQRPGPSEFPVDCSLPVFKVEREIESLHRVDEKIPLNYFVNHGYGEKKIEEDSEEPAIDLRMQQVLIFNLLRLTGDRRAFSQNTLHL